MMLREMAGSLLELIYVKRFHPFVECSLFLGNNPMGGEI